MGLGLTGTGAESDDVEGGKGSVVSPFEALLEPKGGKGSSVMIELFCSVALASCACWRS